MNRSRLRAFTLLELLVVIGLIAILGSLLLIGVNHLIIGGKRQATQLAFQNCQAMFSEWDRVSRMHFASYMDPHYSSVAVPCPQDLTTVTADRQGNVVLLARDMFSLMRNMPVNAAALGKMSARATMTFSYMSSGPFVPPVWATGTQYYVADRVQNGTDANSNPVGFVCIQAVPNNTYAPPGYTLPYYAPTTDTNYWLPAIIDPSSSQAAGSNGTWNVSTVPVLLDGWGNPIIFVPGGVLGYPTASASGKLTAGGTTGFQVQSPDGRPFWASAGPDGIMSAGDDNMYSFEK